MAIKPILFNTDMVQAILEGRKTQTRRIVKSNDGIPISQFSNIAAKRFISLGKVRKAPCSVGDILWVRETWFFDTGEEDYDTGCFMYKADMPIHIDANDTAHGDDVDITAEDYKWRPSIHMPKEAARIFLLVKNVRAERLQEISFDDCKAEGIWDDYKASSEKHHENLQRAAYPVVFKDLWNSTIRKTDLPTYGWEANPWVWVIEFERCEKPKGW